MPMTENSEVENSFTKIKNTILSPSPPETTTFAGDANLPLSWQRLWRSFLGRDDQAAYENKKRTVDEESTK